MGGWEPRPKVKKCKYVVDGGEKGGKKCKYLYSKCPNEEILKELHSSREVK